MATLSQIEANRRNAQSSTGPRTAAGKAASRFNALKSGIDAKSSVIRGEDPDDLEVLTFDYYQRFQPAAPEERCLTDALIAADWQLRRLRKAEAEIWEHEMSTSFRLSEESPRGQIASNLAATFARFQRRLDSTERSFHRSLDRLQRLQSNRAHPPEPPPPEIGFVPSPAAEAIPTPLAPVIGFVPPTPPPAVSGASPCRATIDLSPPKLNS